MPGGLSLDQPLVPSEVLIAGLIDPMVGDVPTQEESSITTTTSQALASACIRLSDHIHDLLDDGDEEALEQAVQQRQELLVTITNYIEGKQL